MRHLERKPKRPMPWTPPLLAEQPPKLKAAGEIERERKLATQVVPPSYAETAAELFEEKVIETWAERKARRAKEKAGISKPKPNMDTSKRRKPLYQSRRNEMRRAARRRHREIEAMRALKPKRRRA